MNQNLQYFDIPESVITVPIITSILNEMLILSNKEISKISIYNLAGKQVFESDQPISQDGTESNHTILKR